MSKFECQITQKGRITIPAAVRVELGLEPGDWIQFELKDGAAVISRAKSKLLAVYGAVTPHNRPEDFAAIREFVEQAIADEVMESMRHESGASDGSPPTRDWKSRAE